MKKTLLIFTLVSLIASCALFRGADAPPFKVTKVTSQKWHAGIAAGGMGTNYAFHLKIRDTGKIKIDTVWLNGRAYRAQLVDMKEDEDMKKIIMSFSKTPKNPGEPESAWEWRESPEKSENPPQYDGTAMIIYHFDGKRKKEVVSKEVEQLEMMNYP